MGGISGSFGGKVSTSTKEEHTYLDPNVYFEEDIYIYIYIYIYIITVYDQRGPY